METLYRLPESLPEDLDKFKATVKAYENGSVSAAQFRAFRVPQGVYEQREDGTYMLRVRFPAGGVLPHQMRALAAVARTYGNGILHVTTRQDIQVHRVLVNDIHPALVDLYKAGLSTKGGGGNTVRNITACCDSGICMNEQFDVTRYACALTEFMLPDPLNYQLPRKFKIAFSGCSGDCSGATVNDVGFIAKTSDGRKGFAVYVGGGMGKQSRVADYLEEFVPGDQVHMVAEAVKRVFDRHGNRKNKNIARLRFLVERIGIERFRDLYEDAIEEVRAEGVAPLEVRGFSGRDYRVAETEIVPSAGFEKWRGAMVARQKQDGYCLVNIPFRLGDIDADIMEKLADLIEVHGEGMLRTSQTQNTAIRWVHENELPAVHSGLLDLGLAESPGLVQRNIVACAGAATCRLGICLSRGLAGAVTDLLDQTDLDLDQVERLNIRISGCPNSCGRHQIGQIGVFGAARRVGDRLVPHYVVQLGGRVTEGKTRLAEGKNPLPARNIPKFIVEFLRAFRESSEYPDFNEFLDAGGRDMAADLIAAHRDVPSFDEDKNFYFDWGVDTPFSLAGRGPGECSAGVFDLIEVDLAGAHEALRTESLYRATVLAARALLVTQGLEARNDHDALGLFTKHFVDAALVDGSYRQLIEKAQRCSASDEPASAIETDADSVSTFVQTVQDLYDTMDPSLRFKPAQLEKEPESELESTAKADREADFRGVVCPLNYVKTKLLLEQMTSGQVLSVLLDEEGGANVPQSAEHDGHEVLSKEQEDSHWRVCIKKS